MEPQGCPLPRPANVSHGIYSRLGQIQGLGKKGQEMIVLLDVIRAFLWLGIIGLLLGSAAGLSNWRPDYSAAIGAVLLIIVEWRLSGVKREMIENKDPGRKQLPPKLPAH